MDIKIISVTKEPLTQTTIEIKYVGNKYKYLTLTNSAGTLLDSFLQTRRGDDVTEEESELFKYCVNTFSI